MKKSLIMLTALMAVASLSGCGNKGNSSSSSPVTSGSGSTTSGATTSATPTTSAGPTTSSTTQQRSLVSISAVYNGDAIDYGGAINKDDVEVTAHYSDSTEEPVEDFTLDYNSRTPNPEMEVTVTFSGKTTTFTVTINKVALSLTASYVGGELKYGSTITKSKVEVFVNYSDGSQSAKLGTTKYDISYNTERKAGNYTDGVVTGKSDYAGLNTNFSFTIARDHLPSGCEDIEAEISRMVTVMNPTVIDPEYHIDFQFNSISESAYFNVSGYQTEKTDLFEIANEIALTLDSNATVSNVPYLDEDGGAYSEYFLTSVGLEMFVYNRVVQGVNTAQIGVFHSSKVTSWPTEGIAARVLTLDETTTTVIPEVDNIRFVSFYDAYAQQHGIYMVNCIMNDDGHGVYTNPTEGYKEKLSGEGWVYQAGGAQLSDAAYTFISPDKKIAMEIAYTVESATFTFAFYANTLGFPFATVNSVMVYFGSTDEAVAPASAAFKQFYTYDYSYYGMYEVYSYYDADPSAEWLQAWENAGWTAVNLFSSQAYETAVISPDGKVCIEYGYNSDYGVFDTYYRAATEGTSWDAAKVAAMVANLVPATSTTVVPEVTGSSHFMFNFYTAYSVGQIYVEFADVPSAIAAYQLVLEGQGWTLDTSSTENIVYISPEEDLKMTIVDYSTSHRSMYLQLESYVAPAAQWPSEQLAALVPEAVRDTIPAYNSEEVSSYQINTTGNVAVYMYTSDIAVTSAGYAAEAVSAGYTSDPDYAEEISVEYVLVSPNEDITIYVYSIESDGIVTCEFVFNPVLSLDELSAFLTAFGYPTDQLETYYNLIKDSEPRATYSSSSGYQYMYFYISDTLLDATKAWCESMGLSLYSSSTETRLTYTDTDYREIDIYVIGDGTIRVIIWEP